MRYEIVQGAVIEEEMPLKVRLVDYDGDPTLEGYQNGRWYWIGYLTAGGSLRLSPDAYYIKGLKTGSGGQIHVI